MNISLIVYHRNEEKSSKLEAAQFCHMKVSHDHWPFGQGIRHLTIDPQVMHEGLSCSFMIGPWGMNFNEILIRVQDFFPRWCIGKICVKYPQFILAWTCPNILENLVNTIAADTLTPCIARSFISNGTDYICRCQVITCTSPGILSKPKKHISMRCYSWNW